MQELVEFTSNNPLLVSGLIASALVVMFNEIRLKSKGVSAISTGMTVRLINDGGAVVDVRETDKYQDAHIIDSHNISEKNISEDATVLDRFRKTIILVCDTGGSSAQCAARLRKAGQDQVYSLKGGLQAWREENLPIANRND
jgi:rhodanese-related sulfurtransferase